MEYLLKAYSNGEIGQGHATVGNDEPKKKLTQLQKDLIWGVFAIPVLFLMGISYFVHSSRKDRTSSTSASERTHTVRYLVECLTATGKSYDCKIFGTDLTYQNGSGGTNQITVGLPWSVEIKQQKDGSFVYLSAQKLGNAYPILHVAIYVDNILLQEAFASTAYGIEI